MKVGEQVQDLRMGIVGCFREETIKRDGLNTATQFYDKDGSQSDIFDNYRLNKGFASYLISPEGVIIAKDPNPEQLTKLIRQ